MFDERHTILNRVFKSILILCLPLSIHGQSPILKLTGQNDSSNLTPYISFWVDSSGHTEPAIAFTKKYIKAPDTNSYNWVPFNTIGDVSVWTRFRVRNETDNLLYRKLTNLLLPPDAAQVWVINISEEEGRRDSIVFKSPFRARGVWSQDLLLPPQKLLEIRVRAYYSPLVPQTISRSGYRFYSADEWEEFWQGYLDNGDKTRLFLFHSFAVGALFFTTLFTFFQFFESRESAYIYYCLYALVISVYGWYWLGVECFGVEYFIPTPFNSRKIEVGCFYAAYFFYFKMLEYFLSDRGGRFKNYLKVLQKITVGIFLINIGLFFTKSDWIWYFFYIGIRLVYEIINLVTILWLFSFRTRLTNYLAIGTLSLALGISISFLAGFNIAQLPPGYGIWSYNMSYYYIGALGEMLLFSAAFAHRYKRLRIERDTSLNSQIEILKREKSAQELLEASQKSQIAALKSEKETRQQLADANIRFLRAQMNPHFIFNTLTALDTLIKRGEKKEASKFTLDFAWLLRRVLKYSRSKSNISLKDELSMLDDYVHLEQMRNPGKFEFKKTIAKDVNVDEILVPPTILQPIVENAIKYGLLPCNKHNPQLSVNVFIEGEVLVIEIEDNGQGRAAAKRNAAIHEAEKGESVGISVTTERIRAASGTPNSQNDLTIIDLIDTEGNPCGTRVRITIATEED